MVFFSKQLGVLCIVSLLLLNLYSFHASPTVIKPPPSPLLPPSPPPPPGVLAPALPSILPRWLVSPRKSPLITEHTLRIVEGKGLVSGCYAQEQVVYSFPAAATDKYLPMPPEIEYAVLDIGTNTSPELLDPCMKDPRCYYMAVDPMEHGHVTGMCAPYRNRCVVFPGVVDFREGNVTFYVAGHCSSVLAAGTGCAATGHRVTVTRYTIDRILDFIPPYVVIQQVITDCQGSDLLAVAGLVRHVPRVRSLVVECQDLPRRDGLFISPFAGSCGDIFACFATFLPSMAFDHCKRNMFHVRELNCAWNSMTNELPTNPPRISIKIPYIDHPNEIIIEHYRTSCPSVFAAGWQNDNFFVDWNDKMRIAPVAAADWECTNCRADSSGYFAFGHVSPVIVRVVLEERTSANVACDTAALIVTVHGEVVNRKLSAAGNVMWLTAASDRVIAEGEWLTRVAQRTHPSLTLLIEIPLELVKRYEQILSGLVRQYHFSNVGLLYDHGIDRRMHKSLNYSLVYDPFSTAISN